MKTNIAAIAAAVCLSMLLTACSSKYEYMGAERRTMQECLSMVRAETGMTLEIITDKPSNVSGRLGDTDRNFGCDRKSTGSKGTYYEGWWQVPKRS